MKLPAYEERVAVEMYEMATRLIALAGMYDATRQVCEWLTAGSSSRSGPEERQLCAMARVLLHADFLASSGPDQAVVVCRADRADGVPGAYELATRQVFTRAAAEEYAKGISASREPIVVTGLFDELRSAVPGPIGPAPSADPAGANGPHAGEEPWNLLKS